MAITDVASRAEGYGFPGIVVDGMDLMHSYEATREAITHARQQGPVLLEMKVERLMPHTTDDDDRRYRSDEELAAIKARDPVVTLAAALLEQGLLTPEQVDEIKAEAQRQVDEATDIADAAQPPDPATLLDNLYAP
jgi:2-oxoisovalerate dehydrogenase E1 component alpha subunit